MSGRLLHALCVRSCRDEGRAGAKLVAVTRYIWVPYLGGCEASEGQVVGDGVDAHLEQRPRTTSGMKVSQGSTVRGIKGQGQGVRHSIGAAWGQRRWGGAVPLVSSAVYLWAHKHVNTNRGNRGAGEAGARQRNGAARLRTQEVRRVCCVPLGTQARRGRRGAGRGSTR